MVTWFAVVINIDDAYCGVLQIFPKCFNLSESWSDLINTLLIIDHPEVRTEYFKLIALRRWFSPNLRWLISGICFRPDIILVLSLVIRVSLYNSRLNISCEKVKVSPKYSCTYTLLCILVSNDKPKMVNQLLKPIVYFIFAIVCMLFLPCCACWLQLQFNGNQRIEDTKTTPILLLTTVSSLCVLSSDVSGARDSD